eukprot:7319819-Heterocapsa_arctica.AAC.1
MAICWKAGQHAATGGMRAWVIPCEKHKALRSSRGRVDLHSSPDQHMAPFPLEPCDTRLLVVKLGAVVAWATGTDLKSVSG